MPTRPASSRIQLPWSRRSSASVVHRWPPTGTYWRASSQIGQRDGDGTANCVPQVAQSAYASLLELLVAEIVVAAAARADARDDRLLRPLVQALAPALHGRQELVEVHLEGGEDPVRPVLHLEPRLARLAAGIVDDVLSLVLGDLYDLRLRVLAHRLLARLRQQPVDLALGLCEHLLPLLDDPARLLDLLRDRRPHLVEDVVDLFAVDPHLVGEGHGLRVVHEVVELVDQYEDVHTGESSDVAGDVARFPGRGPGTMVHVAGCITPPRAGRAVSL